MIETFFGPRICRVSCHAVGPLEESPSDPLKRAVGDGSRVATNRSAPTVRQFFWGQGRGRWVMLRPSAEVGKKGAAFFLASFLLWVASNLTNEAVVE